MRTYLFISLSIFVLWVSAPCLADESTAAKPMSLSEAYNLSLEQSEALKLSAAEIEAAEIKYRKAFSSALPNLAFGLTERVRNDTTSSSSSDSIGTNSGSTGFVSGSKDKLQSAITVTVPLFSGFREFLAADAAHAQGRAAKQQTERAKELLLLDVAEIYFQIVLYHRDLAELKNTATTLKERVKELKEFQALGKSQESEVYAAEAEVTELAATVATTAGLLAESRELLAFLTGDRAANASLSETKPQESAISLASYLARGEERADIIAATELESSAASLVTAAERQRWPSMSLQGNSYPYEDPDTSREWDVLLKMDIPIFDSGRISADVDEKALDQRRASLRTQEIRRQVKRDIRVAYSNLSAALENVKKLKQFVADSEKSYEFQHRDYQNGLVNNITVLESIRRVEDARRQLLRAETQADLNRVRLEVAAGKPLL